MQKPFSLLFSNDEMDASPLLSQSHSAFRVAGRARHVVSPQRPQAPFAVPSAAVPFFERRMGRRIPIFFWNRSPPCVVLLCSAHVQCGPRCGGSTVLVNAGAPAHDHGQRIFAEELMGF
jgi:hypothetical protein